MPEIDIENIIEGDRFRKNYGPMEDLMASIAKFGILQPIVIDRENKLLAGGRRYQACKRLGLKTIPATYIDECNDLKAREIELEENIQREDMHYTERALLVEEIHRLKRQIHGAASKSIHSTGWAQTDTATALDISQGQVAKELSLAAALHVAPEIAEAPNRTAAIKLAKRCLQECERELALRRAKINETAVHCGDAVEVLKQLDANSVDCIIMDPPYGTDVQDSIQHANIYFDDSAANAVQFMVRLLPELLRVSKPNAHWYIFFSIALTPELMHQLDRFHIEFDDVPLIWVKDTVGTVEWDQRFAPAYEPIIFCYHNRQRILAERSTNVFDWKTVPVAEKHSGVEKPIQAAIDLIKLSTQPGELVLDPCCGSGFVPVAAKLTDRRYFACDIDETAIAATKLMLAEAAAELATEDLDDDD